MFNIHTQKEVNALNADRNSLVAKCSGLETEVTNLQNMSKDMTEKQIANDKVLADLKAAHETAINTMKADYDKQISDLKANVVTETASATAKAVTILANVGVPADTISATTKTISDSTKEAKLAKFVAMPNGVEKTAYYNNNRSDIVRASNEKAAQATIKQ